MKKQTFVNTSKILTFGLKIIKQTLNPAKQKKKDHKFLESKQ